MTDAAKLPLMLGALRLPTIGRLWQEFAAQADREGWGAARFLATLCEHELAERAARRIARHLAPSDLPAGKTLTSFDCTATPTPPSPSRRSTAWFTTPSFSNSTPRATADAPPASGWQPGRCRRAGCQLSPASAYSAGMSFQDPNALQIRVTLAEIEPAIWRRLIVPRSFHLGQLHRLIQAAFGWWDGHLHEFRIGGLSYRDAAVCEPEFEDDARSFDESEVRLRDFDRSEGLSFLYIYDFGDNGEHAVAFERLFALDPAPRAASCSGGARARPPEDVGGVPGYAEFLAIIADPDNPEHRDTKRWAGGHFDPEWFDREMTDKDVRNALRANRRIRLHQPRPKSRTRSS
jgi:hypothetical protein